MFISGFRGCAFQGDIQPPEKTSVHYMHLPVPIIGTSEQLRKPINSANNLCTRNRVTELPYKHLDQSAFDDLEGL